MYRAVHVCVLSALLAFSFGCEDDEIDHRPADGMAALGIDNNTSSDIDVYIDGTNRVTVGDWSERAFDIEPGTYRLFLKDEDGDRTYGRDIDLLENNLTEVTVSTDFSDFDAFNVTIVFRD